MFRGPSTEHTEYTEREEPIAPDRRDPVQVIFLLPLLFARLRVIRGSCSPGFVHSAIAAYLVVRLRLVERRRFLPYNCDARSLPHLPMSFDPWLRVHREWRY